MNSRRDQRKSLLSFKLSFSTFKFEQPIGCLSLSKIIRLNSITDIAKLLINKFKGNKAQKLPKNLRVHFITFASSSFKGALNRIKCEAESLNIFDTITCFTEDDLSEEYRKKYGVAEGSRGYGYWIWKSYITKSQLERIAKNDILLYADAGCSFNIEGRNRFIEYLNILRKSNRSNLAFQLMGYQEKAYTKADLFKYFNVEQNEQIKDSGQLIATLFFLKKNSKSLKLIDDWYSICHQHPNLINDTPSAFPNDDSFIDHRHDQSLFSVLRKLHGCEILHSEFDFWEDWDNYKQFPIHARRWRV